MNFGSACAALLWLFVSTAAFAQSTNESTLSLPTEAQMESNSSSAATGLQPLEVDGEAEQIEVRQGYESLHSETVIPASKIQKANAQNVGEILQKQPGVTVTGGAEEQNRKVTIRGLDGYRVIQQVDGAERTEATQGSHSSSLILEPENLTQIKIKTGAESVDTASGAIGGVIQYKTISPDELLQGKSVRTRVKLGTDSATEGQTKSLTTAAKVGEQTSVLLGVTQRDNQRVQSGSPNETGDVRQEDEVQSERRSYLGKVQHKTASSLTEAKLEYSSAISKNASYMAGYGESNSDYSKSTMETVLEQRRNVTNNINIDFRTYYNETASVKDTHSAFRNIPSTLGRSEDSLKNSGTKLSTSVTTALPARLSAQTDVGLETLSNQIAEDDGTANPEYGASRGYDNSVFAQNALSFRRDLLVLTTGARVTNYHRQSDKLALNSPSRNDDTFSGLVGLAYQPVDWFKVSTKFALSNRAPNVREMYYGGGAAWACHRPSKVCTNTPNPGLNEESANSREVSLLFKTPEEKNQSLLKITYFDESIGNYIEWMPEMYRLENGQRVMAGPADATHREYQYKNLANVLRRGIETQAQTEVRNWRLGTSYAMIRMDCVDCPDMYSATTLDEPLPSAPADKIGLSVEYSFRSLNIEVGADAQFVSEQDRLSDRYKRAGYTTPAYEVYGLSLMWSPKFRELADFNVDLDISNLLDRKYTVHNSPSGTFELGRNVSVSVSTLF